MNFHCNTFEFMKFLQDEILIDIILFKFANFFLFIQFFFV